MNASLFAPAALGLCALLGASSALSAQTTNCTPTTWNLWAGQTNDVGSLSVWNDLTYLYVRYTLDWQNPSCPDGAVDAKFGTLHLWVGDMDPTSPSSTLPRSGKKNDPGAPIPGQFPYISGKSPYPDSTGLQDYTFKIPLTELGITDVTTACGKTIWVVAHAEVTYLDCSGQPNGGDTAFGGDTPGDGPRWWFYGAYKICCDGGQPQVPFCQTAYAKGGWIWTTQKRSNPENLPSLELTMNRWGWAIKLTSIGQTDYPIYAGAGLNDITKGTLVGKLTVTWDGLVATVKYDLLSGYTLKEVHIYAGDEAPETIAPGQYGYTKYFEPPVGSYTSDLLPLVDSNANGVWVVAHAVVCFPGN